MRRRMTDDSRLHARIKFNMFLKVVLLVGFFKRHSCCNRRCVKCERSIESLGAMRDERSASLNCVRAVSANGIAPELRVCSATLVLGISLVKASPSRIWLLTDWKAVNFDGTSKTWPPDLGGGEPALKSRVQRHPARPERPTESREISGKPFWFRIEHPVTSYFCQDIWKANLLFRASWMNLSHNR